MTTTDQILQFKRTIRETRIAEAQECWRIVCEAAKRVEGHRLKHMGIMEGVSDLAKHLKNLQSN